jgi:sulfide dehydrogenase cytochrome subunit
MIRNMTLTMLLVAGAVITLVAVTSASAADVGKLAEDCDGCHGKDGVSTEPGIPTIAGFSAQYTIDSMFSFQDKGRPCTETKYSSGPNKGKATDMCKAAAEISEGDIEALGDYYAAKKFMPAKQTFDAGKAKKGEEIHSASCDKCHEEAGSSAEDDAGFLAGQWTPYLKLSFEQFASGERPLPKKMKPKMDKLSKDDIDALLNYYASMQ